MKKLLTLLLPLIIIGCETPSLELEIESPEIPVYQEPEETSEETTEEDTESLEINVNLEDIEFVFQATENPFEEIIKLDDRCAFETYLEENSSDIVIAEATMVDTKLSRLQVLEWQKGQPKESNEQIIFSNDISTAPEFDEDGIYKIYLSNIDGTYQVTCHFMGIIEVNLQ